MIRIVLVVAGIMLLAGPARSLEPRMMKDLPLSRNDVGDLLLLYGIMMEIGRAAENGEVPTETLAGKTGREIMQMWLARNSARRDAGLAIGVEPAASRGVDLDAGNGFMARNVYVEGGAQPKIAGVIDNLTDHSYGIVSFRITLYDQGGAMIGSKMAYVHAMVPGIRKPFEVALEDIQADRIATFKIQYESGM